MKKDLYEVELLKSTIEHREPIIVGFFIPQNAKLRMLEIYYNFFHKYCEENNFEELEMDTDSLYLALAEDNLDNCILRRDSQDFLPVCCYIHSHCVKRGRPDFTQNGSMTLKLIGLKLEITEEMSRT